MMRPQPSRRRNPPIGALTQQANNTAATGRVISQDPANGSSMAEPGEPGDFLAGKEMMMTVPNVEGLTQDAATTTITGAKLIVGTRHRADQQHGGYRQRN